MATVLAVPGSTIALGPRVEVASNNSVVACVLRVDVAVALGGGEQAGRVAALIVQRRGRADRLPAHADAPDGDGLQLALRARGALGLAPPRQLERANGPRTGVTIPAFAGSIEARSAARDQLGCVSDFGSGTTKARSADQI